MKYVGSLYGKWRGKYIPLECDTGDIDKARCLLEEIIDNHEADAVTLPHDFIEECKQVITKL